MSNCTFSSNTAAVNGAGVFQELTKGTLDACILRANKAQVRLMEAVSSGLRTALVCSICLSYKIDEAFLWDALQDK